MAFAPQIWLAAKVQNKAELARKKLFQTALMGVKLF